MTISVAIPDNGDRVEDKPIYLRISGIDFTKSTSCTSWYVIEEKQSSLSFVNEVAGCKSEKDTVRRLPLPEHGLFTNNVAVINSRVYLIGGESYTRLHAPLDDGSLGYYHLDLNNLDSGVEEWRIGGGKHAEHQCRGGVALGHDGSVYSIGPYIYRLRPGADSWERLPTPPQGPYPRHHDLRRTSFLGITKDKLYVYSVGGGGCLSTSALLSFDFQSNEWDEVLDDNLYGDWSPGVVLCDDRYLVSFGTRSPKLLREEVKLLEEARRLGPAEEEEEVVPGLYVFDLQKRQWLPEPVEGLPNDGTVIPEPHRRLLMEVEISFSPQLFQIREDDDHYLALLWDSFGESGNREITWCKFMLDVCTTTEDDDTPRFSAHSLSPGFCSLDEGTGDMLNCVVGMDVSIGI